MQCAPDARTETQGPLVDRRRVRSLRGRWRASGHGDRDAERQQRCGRCPGDGDVRSQQVPGQQDRRELEFRGGDQERDPRRDARSPPDEVPVHRHHPARADGQRDADRDAAERAAEPLAPRAAAEEVGWQECVGESDREVGEQERGRTLEREFEERRAHAVVVAVARGGDPVVVAVFDQSDDGDAAGEPAECRDPRQPRVRALRRRRQVRMEHHVEQRAAEQRLEQTERRRGCSGEEVLADRVADHGADGDHRHRQHGGAHSDQRRDDPPEADRERHAVQEHRQRPDRAMLVGFSGRVVMRQVGADQRHPVDHRVDAETGEREREEHPAPEPARPGSAAQAPLRRARDEESGGRDEQGPEPGGLQRMGQDVEDHEPAEHDQHERVDGDGRGPESARPDRQERSEGEGQEAGDQVGHAGASSLGARCQPAKRASRLSDDAVGQRGRSRRHAQARARNAAWTATTN